MFWCLVTIVDFEWNYVQVIDAMHINLTEDRRTHPNFFSKTRSLLSPNLKS